MERPDLLPKDYEGRLHKLLEETGEFLKAYGKRQLFGKIATDPLTGTRYDNEADMIGEMKDMAHALKELGIIPITQT